MDLEERTLDDNLADRCEVCGASLTEPEILAAREEGPPFLCSAHALEVAAAEVEEPPDAPSH